MRFCCLASHNKINFVLVHNIDRRLYPATRRTIRTAITRDAPNWSMALSEENPYMHMNRATIRSSGGNIGACILGTGILLPKEKRTA